MAAQMRRVVVTGLGAVSPLGSRFSNSWENLLKMRSGIRSIDFFDTSDMPCKIAGLVPVNPEDPDCFVVDNFMDVKEQRKCDRFIHYAVAAAHEAVMDSGWVADSDEKSERTGVMVGSGIGGLPRIQETVIAMQEGGFKKISPFFIPASLINLSSGHISIKHNFRGPNHATVTACASGSHAIGDAARLIQLGDADVMVAGGAEAAVCRVGIGGFASMRALSTAYNDSPHRSSRPWDKDRDGFVMGEGAGILVLEEYEHAKARGAKIYAELVGYGLSGDAYHVTAPAEDGDGGFRAMSMALSRAGLNTEDIDYINAHGTSTPLGDEIELGAIKRMFASSLEKISVSSTKSSIGHLLGAAGGVEAVFSVLALRDQVMPPTLNLESPSESCLGIDLVPLEPRQKKLRAVLSNSFGFGGTNATLIFKNI
jgi:3-oxoacyl-[acyl-carrier-protein] synthase II